MAGYDQEMFPDAGAAAAPEAAPVEASEPAPTGEEGGETAVLPKEFFQGKPLEPGTRCEVEIVRSHDDMVEVSYVPHAEGEPAAAEEAVPMAPPGDAELGAMME